MHNVVMELLIVEEDVVVAMVVGEDGGSGEGGAVGDSREGECSGGEAGGEFGGCSGSERHNVAADLYCSFNRVWGEDAPKYDVGS